MANHSTRPHAARIAYSIRTGSYVWPSLHCFRVLCRNSCRANQEPISSQKYVISYIANGDSARKGTRARERAIAPAVEIAESPLELLRNHVRQEAPWDGVRSHCRWRPTANDKSFRYLNVGCNTLSLVTSSGLRSKKATS